MWFRKRKKIEWITRDGLTESFKEAEADLMRAKLAIDKVAERYEPATITEDDVIEFGRWLESTDDVIAAFVR